jgi:LacI family transcriptional regulator
MGHRKIAFIHGEETAVTRIRIASFYRTCRELGLEVPAEYVVSGTYHDPSASAAATRQLLTLKNKPTCIIYPDDISYIGGWNELEKQGLTVPNDICTAGYDGIHFSQLLRPKLTTLRQDADLMGSSAADELARAVEEGKLYIPGRILIPGELLPGETVRNI